MVFGWRKRCVTSSRNRSRKLKLSQLKYIKDKCPFVLGEKVLCFEPDPDKYRNLYDAKVLKIGVYKNDDQDGKQCFEYLIHFQGWNSSWDRYVTEEFVLKDSGESRELQKELAEDAEKMKEMTKKKRKTVPVKPPAEGIQKITLNPTPLSARAIKVEPGIEEGLLNMKFERLEVTDESGEDEKVFPVPLMTPDSFRKKLEEDRHLVQVENRLTIIPARPNVVQILEDYVKYFGLTEISAMNKKMLAKERTRKYASNTRPKSNSFVSKMSMQAGLASGLSLSRTPAKNIITIVDEKLRDELSSLFQEFRTVKEVVDGIRIIFDFMLSQILLYGCEREQFEVTYGCGPHTPYDTIFVEDYPDAVIKSDTQQNGREEHVKEEPKPGSSRGRRPNKLASKSTQNNSSSTPVTPSRSGKETRNGQAKVQPDIESLFLPLYKKRIEEFTKTVLAFRMLPESMYTSSRVIPSLLYGTAHLLRLFVKMPDILVRMKLPKKRLNVVVRHLNLLIWYMMTKTEYGVHMYHPKIKKEEDDPPPPKRRKVVVPLKITKARKYTRK